MTKPPPIELDADALAVLERLAESSAAMLVKSYQVARREYDQCTGRSLPLRVVGCWRVLVRTIAFHTRLSWLLW